ncbi:MAG: YraN family protein [Deltaproteobacteria bacterium]|nr:YraN family protein [Deltaproteobacteria bacterium]
MPQRAHHRAAERLLALERGQRAEELVYRQLLGSGRLVIARNWKGGGGELDLVARSGDKLRFIEVRAWSEVDRDSLHSITPTKVARLRRAAEAFLISYAEPFSEACFCLALVRDDVVRWVDHPFDAE